MADMPALLNRTSMPPGKRSQAWAAMDWRWGRGEAMSSSNNLRLSGWEVTRSEGKRETMFLPVAMTF